MRNWIREWSWQRFPTFSALMLCCFFFFSFSAGKISGLVHYRTAPTALNSTVGGRGSSLAALPQNCCLEAGTVFFWLCIKAKPNSLVKGNCHLSYSKEACKMVSRNLQQHSPGSTFQISSHTSGQLSLLHK